MLVGIKSSIARRALRLETSLPIPALKGTDGNANKVGELSDVVSAHNLQCRWLLFTYTMSRQSSLSSSPCRDLWLNGRSKITCEEWGIRMKQKSPWKTSPCCNRCLKWDRRSRKGERFACVAKFKIDIYTLQNILKYVVMEFCKFAAKPQRTNYASDPAPQAPIDEHPAYLGTVSSG